MVDQGDGMAYLVKSPGSCGEFIQGYMEGYSFMVTCPVNRYSYAMSGMKKDRSASPLPPKAEQARIRTLSAWGKHPGEVPVRLSSFIPAGKGMASSTADISAVCQAAALACGHVLTSREIAETALSIEPSDATFFQGIVEFDYRKGTVISEWGHCPDMKILVFDCGGQVDTMQFNRRAGLTDLQKKNESSMRKAVNLFREGLRSQSLDLIGRAATVSAFANQSILHKQQLPRLYEAGKSAGSTGVIAAHSGTVLGLIFPPDAELRKAAAAVQAAFQEGLEYLDCVRLVNDGLTYKECDDNEFPAGPSRR